MITYLITGATSGIGLSILKILSKKKIKIIVIGRSIQKWKIIKQINPTFKKIKFIEADLSDIDFIKKIKKNMKSINKIDVMINNAGLINYNLELNSINYEKTFFTNFLSVFLLIKILKPKILKSKLPIVINTSSFVSRLGEINFKNFKQKKNYDSWQFYKNSKLMLSILTNYYSKIFMNKIIFLSWSPGYTSSNLGVNSNYFRKIIFYIRKFFGKDTKKAAEDFYYILFKFNDFKYSGSFIFKRAIVLNNFFNKKIIIAKKIHIEVNKVIYKYCR
jgi:NAD(P)-dependent dehydrogenase (short-subunit alcohol dehydrogenase family)